MTPLSLHQKKLIAQAASALPPASLVAFYDRVASRLSKSVRYRDIDVARVVRLAERHVQREAA